MRIHHAPVLLNSGDFGTKTELSGFCNLHFPHGSAAARIDNTQKGSEQR